MLTTDRRRFGPRTFLYSLDEAASIRKQFNRRGHESECPRCGNLLKRIEGEDRRGRVELVTCWYCGVSLVVELSSIDIAR